jgi:AMP phosphorylase
MNDQKSAYSQIMSTKFFDIEAKRMICVMNHMDAVELGVFPLDRVELKVIGRNKSIVTVVDVTKTMVRPNQLGVFRDLREKLSLDRGERIRVKPVPKPASVDFIKKKLDGQELSEKEIKEIVDDMGENALSEVESGVFVASVYMRGYTLDETVAMTRALTENGKQLRISKRPVVDKHCIGGTNGRTTMIVVPIVAAAGCYIPKTSSRSITSAAGTADVMEVLANVSMPISKIKSITERLGGVMAWGGALDLAPVDDEIIKIEHPFSLDPPGQIIASVMAKKASVGSKYLVIDLPIGPDVKIHAVEKARDMARKFVAVGKKLGMKVKVLLTDGTQPIGRAFGPALEAKYVMQILEGQFFDELAQKSCELSGTLLELSGKAKKGKGYAKAKEILASGKALKKMQQIIKAQGGKALKSCQVPEPKHGKEVLASEQGRVDKVNVRKCSAIARMAGAPGDKNAGLFLFVEDGNIIKKKQPLFKIYGSNRRKLKLAVDYAKRSRPVELERSVIARLP